MAQARKTPEPGVEVVVFAAEAIFLGSVEAVFGVGNRREDGKTCEYMMRASVVRVQVLVLGMSPVARGFGLLRKAGWGTQGGWSFRRQRRAGDLHAPKRLRGRPNTTNPAAAASSRPAPACVLCNAVVSVWVLGKTECKNAEKIASTAP